MTHKTPDVAAILAQVRAEVQAQRQAMARAAADPAQSALERQLQRCLEQIEITRVISAHWPLQGRSLYERAWILVHKLVRRYLRWYINPIVEQQNQFNDVVARTLHLLVESHAELRGQIAALKQADGQPAPHNRDHGSSRSPTPALSPGEEPNPREPGVDTLLPATVTTEALQALVERLGCAEPPAALLDTHIRPLLPQLAQRQRVNAHWVLPERTLSQRVVAFVQKLTRRYLRWLINPIVEQQNAFNGAVTETIPLLLAVDVALRAELAARRAGQARR